MERLKDEVLHNAIIGYKAECKFGCPTALDKVTLEFLYELKNYRDLEEQGRLIVLPVAEGETVYALGYIIECEYDYDCQEIDAYKCECDALCEHEYKVYKVNETKFQKHMLPMIGKNIFLTKSEAEKALAEMEK